MMKTIRLLIIGLLVAASSGCFPVFVPVDGGHEGHHEGHGERGGGGHGEHR